MGVAIPHRLLDSGVSFVRPRMGLVLVVVVGLAMAVWSYFLTRLSGYWDDTVLVVALARSKDLFNSAHTQLY